MIRVGDRGDLADGDDRLLGLALDGGDPAGDVVGGLGRLLGQVLDLGGDDGESLAGLAGAGGLDGGVEREQVGLLGDRGDQLDDAADLGGGLAELGDDLVGALGGARGSAETLAASVALPAISRIEAPISSAPAATVCTLRDTSPAAVATLPAWAEVSSAAEDIWVATLDSSSEAAAT